MERGYPKHGDRQGMPTWMSVSVHTFLSIFRLRTLDTPAPRPRCSPEMRARHNYLGPPFPVSSSGRPGAGLQLHFGTAPKSSHISIAYVLPGLPSATVGPAGHFPSQTTVLLCKFLLHSISCSNADINALSRSSAISQLPASTLLPHLPTLATPSCHSGLS